MQPTYLEFLKTSPDLAKNLSAIFKPYSVEFMECMLPILHAEGALKSDGGLNNRANDRGGLTKFGISQSAFPKLDISSLTLSRAVRIYHTNYWRPMHCKHVDTGLALMLLDGAVQHGVNGMTQLLQKKANSKPDGIFGPLTLKATLSMEPASLLIGLGMKRARKYARICAQDSSQIANLEGWFNRLEHITDLALKEVSHG
ncbi:glycosyl hydrolase 108 family protein [Pseudoalteromonas umbrosa]|uniref:glycosyl hydrolase 108 family protein n=1 Tax=Pseudoalteromonas umbrosa TaxID=3048489 RepID=UPI0024C399B7|nr:glycosyl hydrolase 108 family protein [Pseudoalteromonas sp. B95]MDK1288509.1 glycosyl hydrolase 108 family protein [Pseudoalteromonas sp. B95]